MKMVLDIGHKVHRMCFFEGQGFLLILEEVVKELLLDPCPFCLLKGGNVEFVVDPKDMLQSFFQPPLQNFAANHAGSQRANLGRPSR